MWRIYRLSDAALCATAERERTLRSEAQRLEPATFTVDHGYVRTWPVRNGEVFRIFRTTAASGRSVALPWLCVLSGPGRRRTGITSVGSGTLSWIECCPRRREMFPPRQGHGHTNNRKSVLLRQKVIDVRCLRKIFRRRKILICENRTDHSPKLSRFGVYLDRNLKLKVFVSVIRFCQSFRSFQTISLTRTR